MYEGLKKLFFTEARCERDEANKSYEALFDKLDVNKDGKVDIVELRAGLADMGFTLGADAAQVKPLTNMEYKHKTFLFYAVSTV